MIERYAGAGALLPRPSLPQATDSVLDLATLGEDVVRVNVPPYPECNIGDRIALQWVRHGTTNEVSMRYAYLSSAAVTSNGTQHEIRVWPLWTLPPGDYDVRYAVTSRTGNSSQSEVSRVEVVGTPRSPTVVTGGVIQMTFFGSYRPGIVATWIVPGAYSVASPGDVLVESLASYATEGASTPNTLLQLYRNGDEAPFASVLSDAAGTTWTPSVDRTAEFVRGDRISVRLGGAQDPAIFLALAV